MYLTLKEAIDRLDLTDVWDMAPNPNGVPAPKRGPVVLKSPFRVDRRGAAFSVDKDLRLFKDHGEAGLISGGIWKFVELCEPNWTKKEIAKEIIRRAGGDPDVKDPGFKPKSRAERHREIKEAGDRAHREFIKGQMRLEPIEEKKLARIPEKLRGTWDNFAKNQSTAERMQQLADERGWLVDWVVNLVDLGKMVFNGKGQPVFAVEAPDDREGLRTIGMHNRWISDSGEKFWAYRPCMKWDKAGIVAAPFVMGSMDSTLWILTEGQWDAVTVWGLLGGFEDNMYIDAAVFGLRGAKGRSVFMELYKREIRKCRGSLLLLPDADTAGLGWTEPVGGNWSFMRQLKAIFPNLEGRLVALKLRRCGALKDVNDFYKSGGLESSEFCAMVAKSTEGLVQT